LNGELVDSWISGKEEHVIRGILSPGETYIMSEKMAADGYAYAEEIQFTVHENGIVERVVMEDRPTQVQIRKTDMVTGEELSGAKLTLKDSNGNIVDQWVSDERPHWIKGQLTAGAEYILTEEIAPKGYLIAEEIMFTVSMDGTIDRVIMEDQREQSKEEPKEEIEPIPELPGEPKKIGYIIAHYEPELKQTGAYKLIQPTELESIKVPRTGVESSLLLPIIGLLVSLIGLGFLNQDRREHYEE